MFHYESNNLWRHQISYNLFLRNQYNELANVSYNKFVHRSQRTWNLSIWILYRAGNYSYRVLYRAGNYPYGVSNVLTPTYGTFCWLLSATTGFSVVRSPRLLNQYKACFTISIFYWLATSLDGTPSCNLTQL